MTFQNSKPGSAARAAFAAVLTLLAGFALAGCRPDEDSTRVAGWSQIDPAQRHPIGVSREPELLTLKVPRGSRGLAPAQRAEVIEFGQRARAADAGNTKLVVAAPAGSGNEVEAGYAVEEVRHLLSDAGIPETSIGLETYQASNERVAPVRVAFFRYVVHAPECGAWPNNLAREPQNLPYHNFGCATQRNFANQVANPADLVEPRTETDRSSERRDKTWDNYTQGKSTGAERSTDEKSTTTSTVN